MGSFSPMQEDAVVAARIVARFANQHIGDRII